MKMWLIKSGLANFNLLQGHKICKYSPAGCALVYMDQKWGVQLTRIPLLTNTAFVLLFIKVVTLCFVDLLYYIC
jgi:hypothetical protein